MIENELILLNMPIEQRMRPINKKSALYSQNGPAATLSRNGVIRNHTENYSSATKGSHRGTQPKDHSLKTVETAYQKRPQQTQRVARYNQKPHEIYEDYHAFPEPDEASKSPKSRNSRLSGGRLESQKLNLHEYGAEKSATTHFGGIQLKETTNTTDQHSTGVSIIKTISLTTANSKERNQPSFMNQDPLSSGRNYEQATKSKLSSPIASNFKYRNSKPLIKEGGNNQKWSKIQSPQKPVVNSKIPTLSQGSPKISGRTTQANSDAASSYQPKPKGTYLSFRPTKAIIQETLRPKPQIMKPSLKQQRAGAQVKKTTINIGQSPRSGSRERSSSSSQSKSLGDRKLPSDAKALKPSARKAGAKQSTAQVQSRQLKGKCLPIAKRPLIMRPNQTREGSNSRGNEDPRKVPITTQRPQTAQHQIKTRQRSDSRANSSQRSLGGGDASSSRALSNCHNDQQRPKTSQKTKKQIQSKASRIPTIFGGNLQSSSPHYAQRSTETSSPLLSQKYSSRPINGLQKRPIRPQVQSRPQPRYLQPGHPYPGSNAIDDLPRAFSLSQKSNNSGRRESQRYPSHEQENEEEMTVSPIIRNDKRNNDDGKLQDQDPYGIDVRGSNETLVLESKTYLNEAHLSSRSVKKNLGLQMGEYYQLSSPTAQEKKIASSEKFKKQEISPASSPPSKNHRSSQATIKKTQRISEFNASKPNTTQKKSSKPQIKTMQKKRVKSDEIQKTRESNREQEKICAKALEVIAKIENEAENDTIDSNSSIDSDDSLIQTQRKLHHEYYQRQSTHPSGIVGDIGIDQILNRNSSNINHQRQDSQGLNNGTNADDMLFEIAKDLVVSTPKKSISRNASNQGGQNSTQLISSSTNKKSKKLPVKNTKISLVEGSSSKKNNKGKQNLLSECDNNVQVQESESTNIKFPLQQYLSANSDLEENQIIQKYSEQRRTIISQKGDNPDDVYSKNYSSKSKGYNTKENIPLNPSALADFPGHPKQRQRASVDISQSAQLQPTSKKSKSNIPQAFEYGFGQDKEQDRPFEKTSDDPIHESNSKTCPFNELNRSPDSFVRISSNGGPQVTSTDQQYAQASMISQQLSCQTFSIKTSEQQSESKAGESKQQMRLSLEPSQNLQTPGQKQEAKQVGKSDKNNIEINIEKILKIQHHLQSIQKTFQQLKFRSQDPFDRECAVINAEAFEVENDHEIQSIINISEEWWNVIREPTVCQQLMKCQKIYSNVQIQYNLQRALVFQLIFFTITGYLMSCGQFSYIKELKSIAKGCLSNYQVMCQILIEKFPQEVVKKNAWANKLMKILMENKDFQSELIQNPSASILTESIYSRIQENNDSTKREQKYRLLRKNNYDISEDLDKILVESLRNRIYGDQSSQEAQDQYYNHALFDIIQEITSNMSSNTQQFSLSESVDKLGRSLREDFDEEETDLAPASQSIKNSSKDTHENLQKELSRQLRVQVDQGLKLVQTPYLPPKGETRKYTLVLDLDETLLHFEELNETEGQLSIRPGADQFLKEMHELYELVIFTAGTEEYADWALMFLDNVSLIKHRLYRQHALPFNGYYVKDLSRLGRDLSKTLIVDNIAENFQLQPNNGIFISTWISDPEDQALSLLSNVLREIALSNCQDISQKLKEYTSTNQQVMSEIAFGRQLQKNENPAEPPANPEQNNECTNIEVLIQPKDIRSSEEQEQQKLNQANQIQSQSNYNQQSTSNNELPPLLQQIGAIDEISSEETEDNNEILPVSMAPQGFLNFQAKLTQEEKNEQMNDFKQLQENAVTSKRQGTVEMMEDVSNYHHKSLTPESNGDVKNDFVPNNSPQQFTPAAYDHQYQSPEAKTMKSEDLMYIDGRDLDKRSKRFAQSDPKEPKFNLYGLDDEFSDSQQAFSNNPSNLRNKKETRTIYTIQESINEVGSSIENQSSQMLKLQGHSNELTPGGQEYISPQY